MAEIQKSCEVCGGLFVVPNSLKEQKFCSRKCYGIDKKAKAKASRPTLVCETCGKTFSTIPCKIDSLRPPKYCSKKCADVGKSGTGPKVLCENCGETFTARPQDLKLGRGRFCSNACRGEYTVKQAPKRFWSRVNKNGPTVSTELGPCWVWTGRKVSDDSEYGRLCVNRKQCLAHRYSWELANGSIPNDLDVCHKCDNPLCVNPDHLFLGTAKENIEDMMRKGRSGSAKLSDETAAEIRHRYATEDVTQRELAESYGVGSAAICVLLQGKTWKHVQDCEDGQ